MTDTLIPIPTNEARSLERLRSHFLTERALADRLRQADPATRQHLYTEVYDTLFREVHDHPMLTRQTDSQTQQRRVDSQLRLLRRYLGPTQTFLEIGAGDCALAFAAAARCAHVIAVDVSAEIMASATRPTNAETIVIDGCTLPLPHRSVHTAYSNQLMEHLHPDDAATQVRSIADVLVPGGVYVCITPNRLSGPHDISKYFSETATGFHLKEYTIVELATLFRRAGFASVHVLVSFRGVVLELPVAPFALLEAVLERLPTRLRRRISTTLIAQALLGVRLIGRTGAHTR